MRSRARRARSAKSWPGIARSVRPMRGQPASAARRAPIGRGDDRHRAGRRAAAAATSNSSYRFAIELNGTARRLCHRRRYRRRRWRRRMPGPCYARTRSPRGAPGHDASDMLSNNDGHGFFEALGDQVITGPTLTNVNDFRRHPRDSDQQKEAAVPAENHAPSTVTPRSSPPWGPPAPRPRCSRNSVRGWRRRLRLNFSHGTHEDHTQASTTAIRALEREVGRPIGVLLDLQGPKLRLGTFTGGTDPVRAGARIRSRPRRWLRGTISDAQALPHPEIFQPLAPGVQLLIDDGKVRARGRVCLTDDSIDARGRRWRRDLGPQGR